jgi:tryptophan 7-halogenase
MLDSKTRSVGVVGGGTAGYFAALALKRRFPALEVCVLESKTIPIIGVGEATTTLLPPFLHGQLGLDVEALYAAVKPTWKLGIKFEWGAPGSFFTYPFGDADPLVAAAQDGHLRNQSLTSMLMTGDRSPLIREADGSVTSLLGRLKWAYHLHNAPFVAFLAQAAAARGVVHVEGKIDRVETSAGGERVEALHLADGRRLTFDLYVDASGFGSLLMEKALRSEFLSYASSLFCDTAVVANVPHGDLVRPYTTAETMDAGWCWRIAVEAEDHRGYVFSSAFLDEGRAIDELRAKNPGASEPWVVRFRSGRHRHFWKGNTVAIGNAYGFVEPLESTALHMVVIELGYLLGCLDEGAAADEVAWANERVGAHWDSLRWFLSVHYKFNGRLETPFWRAARAEVDIGELQGAVDRFRATGPWVEEQGRRFGPDDPTFGHSGLMMMLLGQGVSGAPYLPPPSAAAAWGPRVAAQQALAARALSQAEALAFLRAHPEVLREGVEGPGAWCRGSSQRVELSPSRRTPAHPRSDDAGAPAPYEALLRPVR